MLPITIDEQALEVIQNSLEKAYPNEGCGFLFGEENGLYRAIHLAVAVKNSKEGDQRRRFVISPRDYMEAEKFALKKGTTLLGIYHSHPDHPAKPSEHDLKQAVPFFSYVIVSVKKGKSADITSWQLNDQGTFAQEEIVNQSIESNNKLNKII